MNRSAVLAASFANHVYSFGGNVVPCWMTEFCFFCGKLLKNATVDTVGNAIVSRILVSRL